MSKLKIASACFSIHSEFSSSSWLKRLEAVVASAAASSCNLLLLPEYFSFNLFNPALLKGSFADWIRSHPEAQDFVLNSLSKLSRQYQIAIVGGTFPFLVDGKVYNRCPIIIPEKEPIFQDKIMMTRFERESWLVSSGPQMLTSFEYLGVTCAVNICYDVEFSFLSEKLLQNNVELLLVPSCTDDWYGYWRVRHCAQARAIENQCYVVMSSLLGGHAAINDISEHVGRAGIFTPCDHLFSENGIKAVGPENSEELLIADLDFDLIRRTRKSGTTLNYQDGKSLQSPSKPATPPKP